MVTSFECARNLILQNTSLLEPESAHLLEASGRVVAQELIAPFDMPLWDNSAMDGYAVRAEDCVQSNSLTVIGCIPAGSDTKGQTVRPGTAIQIMTGAPIPEGCTAIIPFEDISLNGDIIHLQKPVPLHDNIRFRGEDIKLGECVLSPRTVLRPPEINLLASLGKTFVSVYRRPQVAILSTGDELVEPGELLGPGQVANSNTFSLAAATQEIGAQPIILGIARDNKESLLTKLRKGLKADVLITSAGVSAGELDLVRDALSELGVKLLLWKVNIKPGRPTAFGLNEGKPVFCLPGNPVSSMVTFEEFVRPALLKMMGHQNFIKPTVKARLEEQISKKPGRLQFLRVKLSNSCNGLTATSAGDQNTGILSTMVSANGIAFLPEECSQLDVGDTVDVHIMDNHFSKFFSHHSSE